MSDFIYMLNAMENAGAQVTPAKARRTETGDQGTAMSADRHGIAHQGDWFTVRRPDGRIGGRMFRCPYRAAEHAMRAYGVAWWPELVRRGIRVVALVRIESRRT